MEDTQLTNIYNQIQAIPTAISLGLVRSIVGTGGIGSAADFGVTLGTTLTAAEQSGHEEFLKKLITAAATGGLNVVNLMRSRAGP